MSKPDVTPGQLQPNRIRHGCGGRARRNVGRGSSEPDRPDKTRRVGGTETPDWIFGFEDTEKVETILDRAKERFLKIDEALKNKADLDASLSGMGTTLTMAMSLGNNLVIGHIGDSRAYLFRDGILTQLTKDHTVAQELIDAGLSGTDPVARSMRHVLTAALGSMGSEFSRRCDGCD